ncbi:MAG: archease [Nitrospira sp.]|nr:archease [Nitrospira sp.]MDR4465175.1 archease [Nitrospira sp.]
MQPLGSDVGPDTCWEHFPHEADIGVRGIGSTKEAAFEGAGLALTAVITDPASVSPLQAVPIACDASDDELLLVDWLNALVYEMATQNMLFSRFQVRLDEYSLHATAWGESVEVTRHQPAVEVKGATYTELAVKKDEQGRWIAQCVVDV